VTRALKLVANGAPVAAEPVTMAAAATDVLATILAQQPVTLTMLWETAGGSELQVVSLPGSLALQQGQAVQLYRLHFPWEFDAPD
jgi:hypothetical protein